MRNKLNDMVMRVERRGNEYLVVLSPEAMEALHLTDGVEVVIRQANQDSLPQAEPAEHRYATVEEGLEAFRRTEHLHRNTYRELAK